MSALMIGIEKFVCMYACVFIYLCMYVWILECLHWWMVYKNLYVCMHVYLFIYLCMYVCMYGTVVRLLKAKWLVGSNELEKWKKSLLLEFLLPQIVLCMPFCMFVCMHVRMYLKYVTVVRLLKAKWLSKKPNRKAEETLTLKFLLPQVNIVFRHYNTTLKVVTS